ncbi:sugar phosphate isomerase/epimerase family protein [Streptomyces sp. NPDC059679]|uniref:sugar phosphate isomerase/epimerase family protein n=1 Tax=Streptomyces sp. NPDC059679 TaxID=3346903 RepID=UPI00369BAFF1
MTLHTALPEVGIFARTFPRATVDEVATAVAEAEFHLAQFNFSAIGMPTLAPDASAKLFDMVGRSFQNSGVSIWGLSATYNIINPDPVCRARQTREATRLIGLSPRLGVSAVTLCSGTRNPKSMWEGHPDNRSPAAWRDMRSTLDVLLEAAANAGVVLGIEPEPTNIINSAKSARRLINELGTTAPRHLGIVLDPGNLVTAENLSRQRHVFDEAFDLLADHIIGLQAKDLTADGPAPLGRGELDYTHICDHTLRLGRPVPTIIQDADAQDAGRSGRYLRTRLRTAAEHRRNS